MAGLADKEAAIKKHLDAIAKLGKSELDDKKKSDFIKKTVEILKEAKTFERKFADLNKRIKDSKSLKSDIEAFRKEWAEFIKRSTTLASSSNKIDPDTKARDYFMIANFLSTIGSSSMLDDYP